MTEQVKVRRLPVHLPWRLLAGRLLNLRDLVLPFVHHLFPSRWGQRDVDWTEWYEPKLESFDFPPMELHETESDFILTAALPGYESRRLQVTASPFFVTVEGDTETRHEACQGQVYVYEVNHREMLRQFRLPVRANTQSIRAWLEDGVLTVTAKKAPPA